MLSEGFAFICLCNVIDYKSMEYYHIRTVLPNNKRCFDVVFVEWVILETLAIGCPIGGNIDKGREFLLPLEMAISSMAYVGKGFKQGLGRQWP